MSKKQPYIYTMPEGFMKDPSVPVKWRLYGLINGFWIAGKPVFASNSYFAKQLNCSERQIQRAIKDLEDDGYLNRDGTSQNRQILPLINKGTTSGVVGGRHGTAVGDDTGRPHSSVSSSDSISREAEASTGGGDYETVPFVGGEIPDEDPPPKRESRWKEKKAVFELFGPRRAWWKSKKQGEAALELIGDRGFEQVKRAVALAKDNRDDPMCPKVYHPMQLAEKWEQLLDYKERTQ